MAPDSLLQGGNPQCSDAHVRSRSLRLAGHGPAARHAATTARRRRSGSGGVRQRHGVPRAPHAAVVQRRTLNCGVNNSVPGFGFETADGTFEGFDIDYCKAIAATVLGDPSRRVRTAHAEQRFPSSPAARSTCWPRHHLDVHRDGAEGAAFVTTTFYDGQAMMVRAAVTSIDALADPTDLPHHRHDDRAEPGRPMAGIQHTPQTFEENAAGPGGVPGRAVRRLDLRPVPARRHPLQLARRPGRPGGADDPRRDLLEGAARPLGRRRRQRVVRRRQLGRAGHHRGRGLASPRQPRPDARERGSGVRRFLGQPVEVEGEEAVVDHGFGVDPDFTVDVIRAVGNYGDHLRRPRRPGLGAPDRARGHGQRPVDRGGLHYSPPFR